jgi:hypothetical protein
MLHNIGFGLWQIKYLSSLIEKKGEYFILQAYLLV